MEKEVFEKIEVLKKRYNLKFDAYKYNEKYGVYALVNEIIEERAFLSRLVSRTKIGIASFNLLPTLPLKHWSLFKDNIDYALSWSEGKKDLEHLIVILKFLDQYFYIDDSWVKKDALLLKKLLKDRELEEIVQYYLPETKLRDLVKESSYYYKDEVWNEVKSLRI